MVFFDYTARMKHLVLAVAYTCALLVAPHSALADQAKSASACYGIGNPDTRAYCMARAHRDTGRCYNIKAADLRSLCLAEVRR